MFFNNLSTEYSFKIPQETIQSRKVVGQIVGLGAWREFEFDILKSTDFPNDAKSLFKEGPNEQVVVSAVACSGDKDRVLKIEFFKHPRKLNSLASESQIIRQLNKKDCVSAPKLIEEGTVKLSDLEGVLSGEMLDIIGKQGSNAFHYQIIEYIPSARKGLISDVIFAMLEQKALGVYQGDIKPDNIRFNEDLGSCVFIDYDQAQLLDENITVQNCQEFLNWCDNRDKQRYGASPGTWRRHFKGLKKEHILEVEIDSALDLSKTTLYKRQYTTNTKNGVYHTIISPQVIAQGVRDLTERFNLLQKVEFIKEEKVLDIGCNAGLLCHYLARRGCLPTGVEMDPAIVVAAKMIANILQLKINFNVLDLDAGEIEQTYDTICLFSVIHHTKNLGENGRNIAKSCNRILIECRLHERGKKPVKNWLGSTRWLSTSVWDYDSEEDLFDGLMSLFPGFSVKQKIGHSDKNRMLLELVKLN